MPDAYRYHYTSRAAVQSIRAQQQLRPGRSGVVYLTPDLYGIGWIAGDRLATPTAVPREIMVAFPEREIAETRIDMAQPIYLDGQLVRRGGGAEIALVGPLAVDPSTVVFLALFEP